MILTSIVLSLSVAQAAPRAPMASMPVTTVRTAAPMIDLRMSMVEDDLGSRGYRLLDGLSESSRRERERLGAGDDAPTAIYVRAFDAIFIIDPFERMDELVPRPVEETLRAQRQIFGEFSLNTDRKLFNWDRVEATAELFRILETARLDWLRTNGYFGVRTFTSGQAREEGRAAREIRPSATFRRPADMPRTRSREQVRRESSAEDAGAMLASSGEPMRVSLPTFDRSQARISMPGQRAGESIAAR